MGWPDDTVARAPHLDCRRVNNTSGGSGLPGLLVLVLIGAVFLFLVTRSNKRRQAQVSQVQSAMTVGAQVLTTAGLYATVVALDDDDVSLEVAPGVVCVYARAAIARVVDEDAAEDAAAPDDDPLPGDPRLDDPGGDPPTSR